MSKKVAKETSVIASTSSDRYRKSNVLIGAKYRSSLVENKLLALSLSKADKMVAEDVNIKGKTTTVFVSIMKSSEISRVLGISNKNLSAQLKSTYQKMAARQIGIEDDGGQFVYRNLFIGADYINGEFKLYYNPLLESYYKLVSKNYSNFSLEIMAKFQSVHSFRLYELLQKECYDSNRNATVYNDDRVSRYTFDYSIAELKLMLGIINSDSQTVRNILAEKQGAPDYEKAVEKAPEKGFERWSDMKRRCIDPAVEEINSLTEMTVSYELKKSGQGGKVHSISFTVEINNAKQENIKEDPITISEEEKLTFIDEIFDLIEERIRVKDAQSIAEAAEYDIEKIKKAYHIAKTSKNVDNLVGFIISAIKNDYSENISVHKPLSGDFGKFKQSDTDLEELSKHIYAN